MGVLRDFKCERHGYFESMSENPSCPMKGCNSDVFVVFLQAPGLISDKTKRNDRNVKQLAMDYDMSDIKSTKEGENQAGFYTRKNKTSKKQREKELQAAEEKQRQEQRPGNAAIWGGAGGMSMKSVLGGQFKPIRDEPVGFNPKAQGNLTGPRAASYTADHENLQIKK